jgi:hypothetical protein
LLVSRPFLARSGFVIFDRYFHDIGIDYKRYRYGGPLWLPRVLARLVPPRDVLFLILDADDQVIISRKPELAPEELRRLRFSYMDIITKIPNAALITTDEGIGQTVTAAARIVALYLAERFSHQYSSWLAVEHLRPGQGTSTEVTQQL